MSSCPKDSGSPDATRSCSATTRDYELVGVPFEERWKRLDSAAVQALRAYWRADDVAFEGAFYSTAGFTAIRTESR